MRTIQLIALFSLFFSSLSYATNSTINIKTNHGTITLELYPDKAPKTVENFLSYVADGFYKETIFHRVIPNFMIQGGGFDKTYTQKPTKQPVINEADNGLKNHIGTIAMARTSDPHSATAQFFINVANNAFLDYSAPNQRGYGYTVFGKVTDGMKIVNEIAAISTGSGGPFPNDVPQSQVIIEDIELISATMETPK